jgi:hypothetical protein
MRKINVREGDNSHSEVAHDLGSLTLSRNSTKIILTETGYQKRN